MVGSDAIMHAWIYEAIYKLLIWWATRRNAMHDWEWPMEIFWTACMRGDFSELQLQGRKGVIWSIYGLPAAVLSRNRP